MHNQNKVGVLLISLVLLLVTGCGSLSSTAKRSVGVAAGAGAGGAIAYKLSNGNAVTTALGAVGGALVTSAIQGEDSEAVQRGFDQGYMQGQSDAIKRQYFLRQAQEKKKPAAEEGEDVVYTVPGPTVSADGTKLAPHQVSVRVVE